MNLIRKVFYFFSRYVDTRERAVGMFFKKLNERNDHSHTRSTLLELLQTNIAVINLWSEYRYKGYKYLRKSERGRLYKNLQLIADDFERFRTNNPQDPHNLVARIRKIAPHAKPHHERLQLLQSLTVYFSPSQNIYEYRESSSFGRLLRDPHKERLVGDCNQIVTLYIYLYSRYYHVSDLKVRQLPGHVALHYQGIDIEATNGTFQNYTHTLGSIISPIEEIVSINLLDTTDAYLATHKIAPEEFLQSARFAYMLSGQRDIAIKNLDAAYGRLINQLMKQHNYTQALKIAKASKDATLIGIVGHNGAVHNMTQHHFDAARRYAQHAPKRDQLIRDSYRSEGAYYYDAHRYHDAIKAFKKYGDQSLVKRCYEALYFDEQRKLGHKITTESIKKHSSSVKRMHTYAKKSQNKKLQDAAGNFLKHL